MIIFFCILISCSHCVCTLHSCDASEWRRTVLCWDQWPWSQVPVSSEAVRQWLLTAACCLTGAAFISVISQNVPMIAFILLQLYTRWVWAQWLAIITRFQRLIWYKNFDIDNTHAFFSCIAVYRCTEEISRAKYRQHNIQVA